MALQLASNTLVIGVHEWFKADLDLQRDFKLFCKTNKYLVVHGAGGQTGGRAQTNQSFKLRNEDLKASILQSLKSKFSETRFVSQQRVMESNEVAGASAKDRWKAMLDKHVQGVFQHHSEASDYAQNKAALLTSAGQNAQVTMNMGLTPAEEKVNNFIDRNGGEVTVTDLFSEFSKEPFGWTQYAILDVAVHLHRKKKREFKYSNEPRYSPVNFVTKALTSAEQSSCVVTTGEAIPMTLLADMRSAYADIFNGTRVGESTDGTEQFDLLKEALDRNVSELTALESDHSAYPWASVLRTAKDMLDGWARIRDPKSMFDAVIAGQSEGKQAMDAVEAIKGFGHLAKYREIQDFIRSRAGDLQTLDAAAQAKVAEVNTFLVSTNPAEGLRLAARQYDELKSALTDKLAALKDRGPGRLQPAVRRAHPRGRPAWRSGHPHRPELQIAGDRFGHLHWSVAAAQVCAFRIPRSRAQEDFGCGQCSQWQCTPLPTRCSPCAPMPARSPTKPSWTNTSPKRVPT